MERHGRIIRLDESDLPAYRKYHKNVWPEHLEMLNECNIHNFSIYYKNNLLFSYFEYTGGDFEKDMKRLEDDPVTVKWMNIMKTMQKPIMNKRPGEFWSEMEEVFHLH